MDILIDNINLETGYGIKVLDYRGAFDFPAERENERVWMDKSGVDKNQTNVRYDAKEFVFSCIVKATNEATAYASVNTLVEYMFSKGVFVLSLRDATRGIRIAFLCERSSTIVGDISIRKQNSLYVFKLGLKDVNPNALKFYNTVAGLSTSIYYDKGQTAYIYWGDGVTGIVSNSGTYSKNFAKNGPVDIIIDIDKNQPVIIPLVADFSGTPLSGLKPLNVQFTDTSTGGPEIWSWDFGDGFTSSLQSPLHTYNAAGVFTVTLQIFNAAKGQKTITKTGYITVTDPALLINGTDFLMINGTDKFLIQ